MTQFHLQDLLCNLRRPREERSKHVRICRQVLALSNIQGVQKQVYYLVYLQVY